MSLLNLYERVIKELSFYRNKMLPSDKGKMDKLTNNK